MIGIDYTRKLLKKFSNVTHLIIMLEIDYDSYGLKRALITIRNAIFFCHFLKILHPKTNIRI